MSAPLIIPAFDPDSPDREILEAQNDFRRQRAWAYSFDSTPNPPEAEIAASDERIITAEGIIHDNHASTVPGIIARLQTLLTCSCDRWIDREMSEGGFMAVYRGIRHLDGDQQQIVHAIHDLYHLHWDQALAAYERAEANLSEAGNVRAATDTIGLPSEVDDAAEAAQNYFIDRSSEALRELLRTFTPNHDAYLRKVEIMVGEGIDNALPWLARDTAFLIGRLYAASPEGAR